MHIDIYKAFHISGIEILLNSRWQILCSEHAVTFPCLLVRRHCRQEKETTAVLRNVTVQASHATMKYLNNCILPT